MKTNFQLVKVLTRKTCGVNLLAGSFILLLVILSRTVEQFYPSADLRKCKLLRIIGTFKGSGVTSLSVFFW